MPRYYVVSPEYGSKQSILDDGSGPTEYGCDWLEIEADSPAHAKAEAIRQWRKQHDRHWDSDENPFKGVQVQDADAADKLAEQAQANADAEAAYEEQKNKDMPIGTTDF